MSQAQVTEELADAVEQLPKADAVEVADIATDPTLPVEAKIRKIRDCKNKAKRVNGKCPRTKRCKNGRDPSGMCIPTAASNIRANINNLYPDYSRKSRIGRMRLPGLEKYQTLLANRAMTKEKKPRRVTLQQRLNKYDKTLKTFNKNFPTYSPGRQHSV